MILFVLLFIEVIVAGVLNAVALSRYKVFVKEHRHELRLPIVAPLSFWMMDRWRLADQLSEVLSRIHQLMVGLYGSKNALTRTKCFSADILSLSIAGVVGSTLLACVSDGGMEMLVYGGLLIMLLPFVMFKELTARLQKKKRRMLLELPEILNQIVLLVNAGETVQKAVMRCVDHPANGIDNPLLTELTLAAHEIRMNASFAKSMEDFNKRCGMQEVSLFTTTLLLNYKRGGDELVMSLKELSFTLWEKRKSLAKTLGEEASSKMVFPMVIIFLVVMVVVAAPAILIMG